MLGEEIFKISGLNNEQLNIAYCPEVLLVRILQELISNDRVIGVLPLLLWLAELFILPSAA